MNMKRFTKKALTLLLSVSLTTLMVQAAEKRYVLALGGYPADGPNWESSWVDLRLNDYERILYIWPSGNSLAGTPAVGAGALGQEGYQAFVVGNLGWWGCGYFVGPDSGLPTAEMDLKDVDDTWVLNFAIRTDCAADITVNLYGSTPDPDDPFVTERTVGRYVLNKTNLPLSLRDKTTWTNFQIPIGQLQPYKDNVLTPSLKLTFKGNLKKQNYLTFSGGNDTGSFIAWDNVYIGKVATGIDSPKAEKLDFQINGNELKINSEITRTVQIFSISGSEILNSNEKTIDISVLNSGIYIIKSGNMVNKFSK